MNVQSFFDNLTEEQRAEANARDRAEHESQVAEFTEAYDRGHCYLCGEAFDQMRSAEPCTHWLLRRAKFKKKDFPKIFERYDYHNIAAFLRWCANREHPLRNINDLEVEKESRKVLSYTIRWKNVEWSFDCSKNDFEGHGGHHSSFPHYHFQMRIDGRPFINFNEFHVPFSKRDLFMFEAKKHPNVRHSFGAAGAGMQEAVDVDADWILEETSRAESEETAVYDLSTVIMADKAPISGDLIMDIIEEAQRTNKTFASVARGRLPDGVKMQTVISPAESIPDITPRTEHKPR
ncbi:hypothetical protein [Massilia sp. Root1485]|uniref:hypothetical protein n=1 Tax=Massilia sp. Root1485 TaxID=1736472 RepID=UPI0006FBD4B0|nr:hypothetical protein [Massilia sp. Root1485]KQZ34309.1 hypothetical protein ASD92_08325 [Massilia sp. Root1485]